MIDTVLAQPLDSGPVRVNAYRQLIDLLAQGRADHDSRLAARAYEAIESLRLNIPREIRVALANALSGARLPVGLVAHFSREEMRDVARFLSLVRLDERDWLALLPGLTLQARSVLRSRRDLPEKVVRALEAFGPADFALTAPEEPEFYWDGDLPSGVQPDGTSAPEAVSSVQTTECEAPAATIVDEPIAAGAEHANFQAMYDGTKKDLFAAFNAIKQHTEMLERISRLNQSDTLHAASTKVMDSNDIPNVDQCSDMAAENRGRRAFSEKVQVEPRRQVSGSAEIGAAARTRKIDRLFGDADLSVGAEPEVASPARNKKQEAERVTAEGEMQVRELLERIDAFHARVHRKRRYLLDDEFQADNGMAGPLSSEAKAADDTHRLVNEAGETGGLEAAVQQQRDINRGRPSQPVRAADLDGYRLLLGQLNPENERPGLKSRALNTGALEGSADSITSRADDVIEFRWEADATGTIIWVDGIAREAVIGRSISFVASTNVEGVDAHVATAFARRVPFRDGMFNLPGDGEASGRWKISGVPFFETGSGRFSGFRGTAFRAGPSHSGIDLYAQTYQAPLKGRPAEGGQDDLGADAVRQIVHELRTPINAIVGFAEMIEQQILGPAAQAYRERAHDILNDAHRLLAAIDDMDAAARVNLAAKQEALLVDVGALVEKIIGRYRGLSAERGIELIGSVAIGMPGIEASEDVLERLISRFFSAVIGAAQQGDRLTYGVGVGEGDSVRIFLSRPHSIIRQEAGVFQAPLSSVQAEDDTSSALGLGFGLRLVRQLVTTLGGDFEVEGSLFTISLPWSRGRFSEANEL